MTIAQAIARADRQTPNQYEADLKIAWLDECERRIKTDVLMEHERSEAEATLFEAFTGYADTTPTDTEMLVKEPYSTLYVYWLTAHIFLWNMEYDKYNNAMMLYQSAFNDFAAYWIRTHTPVQKVSHLKL